MSIADRRNQRNEESSIVPSHIVENWGQWGCARQFKLQNADIKLQNGGPDSEATGAGGLRVFPTAGGTGISGLWKPIAR